MKKLTSFIISLALIFIIAGPVYTADRGNTTLQSFSKAKKILLRQVYQDHKTTFYCNCPFTQDMKILPSDNYTQRRNRAELVVWNGNMLSLPMTLVRASLNGEMATQNVRIPKANLSSVETVPGKWCPNSDIWSLIYIIWSRRLERLTA
jgi:hypothetical protein